MFPELHEHLLRDLLGRRGGVGHATGHAVDEAAVAVVDVAEGTVVAGDDAIDQRAVRFRQTRVRRGHRGNRSGHS